MKLVNSIMIAAMISCSPAAYEVIRPKKDKADTPQPTAPESVNTIRNLTNSHEPSAEIEVIVNNQSVTQARVGVPTTIRPTADSLDPDYIGQTSCANPGLILAEYGIQGEASPKAERKDGCETPGVPYTFTKAGEYEITLRVVSQDKEDAEASMILSVIDGVNPSANQNYFKISANPLVQVKGGNITFTASCYLGESYKVTWDFGDNTEGTGLTVVHAYQEAKAYLVKAICTGNESGKTLHAKLTTTILDESSKVPGTPQKTSPNSPEQSGKPTQGKPGQGVTIKP